MGSNPTPGEAFFWCSLLPVLSYLTATCEAILSVKEWNRKMKIKQRKRTVVIKNCVVRKSVTRKQSQFILNWGPCPSLVSPLPNTVCTFFIFRVWGGAMTQWPPLRTLVATPTGKRPRSGLRTRWRDYILILPWFALLWSQLNYLRLLDTVKKFRVHLVLLLRDPSPDEYRM